MWYFRGRIYSKVNVFSEEYLLSEDDFPGVGFVDTSWMSGFWKTWKTWNVPGMGKWSGKPGEPGMYLELSLIDPKKKKFLVCFIYDLNLIFLR